MTTPRPFCDDPWRRLSPNFVRNEFACKCRCGFVAVSPLLVYALESLRALIDAPIIVTSACRCHARNLAVGGSVSSLHTRGLAADIHSPKTHHRSVWSAALHVPLFASGGIGLYDSRRFVHVDHGPGPRLWYNAGTTPLPPDLRQRAIFIADAQRFRAPVTNPPTPESAP